MAAFSPALYIEEYIWKSPTPCLLIPSLCVFDGLSQGEVNRLFSILTMVQTLWRQIAKFKCVLIGRIKTRLQVR